MMKPFIYSLILLTLLFPDSAFSYTRLFTRSAPSPPEPFKEDVKDHNNDKDTDNSPSTLELAQEAHDINEVYLMVNNWGLIGHDQITGNGAGFFPRGTGNNYVFATGLWFGSNYDADGDSVFDKVFTIACNPLAWDSEFREGRNDQDPDDPLTRVFDSMNPDDIAEWPPQFSDPGNGDPIVFSDQDLVTTYTTKDALPGFGQFQLPLEVNQRSMAVISPDSID